MTTHTLAEYVPEQVALYLTDHVLTHTVVRQFDPRQALAAASTTPEVIAIDLGGDKLRISTYTQTDGGFTVAREEVRQARGGTGYLSLLRDVADDARARAVPVGISAAVRLDGSVILRTTNLQVFHEELAAGFDSDFRSLFENSTAVVNDTAAGIAGAAVHLALKRETPRNLVFFICGSGLGASVIDNGTVVHVEAAHVPLVDALNPLNQSIHCHVAGKDFVCVERVTAMRSGIELLHKQLTGNIVGADTLGRRADTGEPMADTMFETSATALAHAIAGVTTRYRFGDDTTVVLHGGAFESASYRARVARRLAHIPITSQPRLVFARDLSSNICLDGAAYLAAMSPETP